MSLALQDGRGHGVSTTVRRLACGLWQKGYPRVEEDQHTVGALTIRQIAADDPSRHQADGFMKAVARQMLTAVSAHAGLDAFEIRITAVPQSDAPARVELHLIAKCRGDDEIALQLVQSGLVAAATCLPSAYKVETAHDVSEILDLNSRAYLVELQRVEHITAPQWDFIPSDYYYHIEPILGDGSGWTRLWHTLARVPSTVVISLLFKPTLLSDEERHAMGSITTDLDLFAENRTQPNILGYDDFYPGDKNAAVAAKAWHSRLQLLGAAPLIARAFVAGEPSLAYSVASQLASAIQVSNERGGDTIALIDHGHLSPAERAHVARTFTELEVWPVDTVGMWRMENPPLGLRRFQYLYGPDEAAAMCVLPVPDHQGVPGFILAREDHARRSAQYLSTYSGPTLSLGRMIHEGRDLGQALLPLSALNRHMLVVGVQGFGKTTAVHTILAELWRKHRLPWLVIEPTRPEYRGLMNCAGMDSVRIYSLGRDDISPLRLNPMEPPPGVRCETHRSALMSIFRLAMSLVPPLPELLNRALEHCYLMAGWDYDSTIEDCKQVPTLRDLANSFEECFQEAGYVGEARNVASAFAVRLRGLLAGGSGRMLDTVGSTDFASILGVPTIFELNEIESAEEKALLAALILHRVRSGATRAGSSRGQLRHVTVIEEAHRILPADAPLSSDSGETTRTRAGEDFVNAIAELRSLGEGFVLCTQRPSRLTRAAAGATNARLIFHLTDAEDRDRMLADIAASESDREVVPRLGIGEFIGRWFPLERPELFSVVPAEGVDTSTVPSDADVSKHMFAIAEETRRLRPYPLCSPRICDQGCRGATRAAGRVLELRTRASRRDSELEETSRPLDQYIRVLASSFADHSECDDQVAYCASMHALLECSPGGVLGLSSSEVTAIRSAIETGVQGGKRE